MATVKLGNKPVGSIVKIGVNGTLRNFIIVHQGLPSSMYDASCNGTWVLMEDIYENRQWHSSNVSDYANSTIHAYLNSTFLNLIDANIRAQIKQVKIPYRPGSGTSQSVNSGDNGLSTKIFLMSDIEVGFTQKNLNKYIVNDGDKLSYFIEEGNTNGSGCQKWIAKLNGSAMHWWLRSPSTNDSTFAWLVNSNGLAGGNYCSGTYGVRPAFILPSTLFVSDDGSVFTNTAPTTPSNINVPGSINGGSTITVSWGASSDAESNLAGYVVERSTNGGTSWAQIYKGTARSTTNAVAFGTATVTYRVKSYDSGGLQSGWRTSAQVPVLNNTAPGTPGAIRVPTSINGGTTITILWNASTDAENNVGGYIVERSTNGGSWDVIYTGAALSYVDTITKGWGSVTYRVRAYDIYDMLSGYATSATRTVNNNTAPRRK